jgi:chromosome segregation ATPase
MARPLSPSDPRRSGTNGHSLHSLALDEAVRGGAGSHRDLLGEGGSDEVKELLHLRSENAQLRTLCAELEQALHEATQQGGAAHGENRVPEYETLLEEKSEMIRTLHHELQQAKAVLAQEKQAPEASKPVARPAGPTPREEELLALSEELERERRQLQEDEQTLMDQMRQMEMSMARERAEMARQRNDLQRIQNEIMHEIERAERNGALVDRIKDLKDKLQDATNRRGAAPATAPSSAAAPKTPAPPTTPSRKEGLLGRWFGRDK